MQIKIKSNLNVVTSFAIMDNNTMNMKSDYTNTLKVLVGP